MPEKLSESEISQGFSMGPKWRGRQMFCCLYCQYNAFATSSVIAHTLAAHQLRWVDDQRRYVPAITQAKRSRTKQPDFPLFDASGRLILEMEIPDNGEDPVE